MSLTGQKWFNFYPICDRSQYFSTIGLKYQQKLELQEECLIFVTIEQK